MFRTYYAFAHSTDKWAARNRRRKLEEQAERQRRRAPEPIEITPEPQPITVQAIATAICALFALSVIIWLLVINVWMGLGGLVGLCYAISRMGP